MGGECRVTRCGYDATRVYRTGLLVRTDRTLDTHPIYDTPPPAALRQRGAFADLELINHTKGSTYLCFP